MLSASLNIAMKTTVYLDESLLARAQRFVPPRGLSQLINDLLSERLAQLERAEVEVQMREGYLAVREERRELNAEWETIEGEGWPA